MSQKAENSPLSVADIVDELHEIRERRRELSAEDKELSNRFDERKILLRQVMADQGVRKVSTDKATAILTSTTVPHIKDFDAAWKWIRENDAGHLMIRRIAAGPYSEMIQAGEALPGVEPFEKEDINLRSV